MVVRNLVTVRGIGREGGEGGVRWKESHRQEWEDSIGRVAADWETGADDASNSKCFSRSYELLAIRPEACTVAWEKSINEVTWPSRALAGLEMRPGSWART